MNVPGLLRKVGEYPGDQAWYLGKPSIDRPLEILDREKEGGQQQEQVHRGIIEASVVNPDSYWIRIQEPSGYSIRNTHPDPHMQL